MKREITGADVSRTLLKLCISLEESADRHMRQAGDHASSSHLVIAIAHREQAKMMKAWMQHLWDELP